MIRIYCDGATNGQPGCAGIGLVIVNNGKQQQVAKSLPKQMTIHEAEWEALLYGLNYLISNQLIEHITLIHTDSQLVVQSIENNFVKNPLFKDYLYQFQSLAQSFPSLNIQWLPGSKNKGADNLAKQGLQKAIRQSKQRK